jgi:hypothetical protein
MSHLKNVDLNYAQHLLRTFRISYICFTAGIVCLFHGVFPFLATNYASIKIKILAKELQ